MQAKQEVYNMIEGLFNTFEQKFLPQHKETIKSLQDCKLSRKGNKMQKYGWEGPQ